MDYEDMIKGMELCAQSRDLLLRNKLDEAKEVVKDTWQRDMYGAMAYCNIGFIQSIMTFDRKNIYQTIQDLDASLQVRGIYPSGIGQLPTSSPLEPMY